MPPIPPPRPPSGPPLETNPLWKHLAPRPEPLRSVAAPDRAGDAVAHQTRRVVAEPLERLAPGPSPPAIVVVRALADDVGAGERDPGLRHRRDEPGQQSDQRPGGVAPDERRADDRRDLGRELHLRVERPAVDRGELEDQQ